ncbi:unnamed protein product, partial [Staurois parvus]
SISLVNCSELAWGISSTLLIKRLSCRGVNYRVNYCGRPGRLSGMVSVFSLSNFCITFAIVF